MKYLMILILLFAFFSACTNTSQKTEDTQGQTNITEEILQPVFSDQFIDGQPINYYLKMEGLSEEVFNYYNGQFDIQQNQETDELINTLITPTEGLTPFYYKCFMNICEQADTSLYTYLGDKCISLLENNTYYCINKLKKGYPDYFTGLVANDIYQRENWEEEINNLSVRLHINLEDEAPELRKELDLFIVGVKNDIEHMK